MPLTFQSLSHGTVVFGFFQIESDMLLLNQLFFFADRFCQAVEKLVGDPDADRAEAGLEGHRIQDPAAIGDLHGAIQGVNFTGFLGSTYRRWPFPKDPAGFKQSPSGFENQADVHELIAPYGRSENIRLKSDRIKRQFTIGEFTFDLAGFSRLIQYVDRGGHPRWRDEIRPAYIRNLMARLAVVQPDLLI